MYGANVAGICIGLTNPVQNAWIPTIMCYIIKVPGTVVGTWLVGHMHTFPPVLLEFVKVRMDTYDKLSYQLINLLYSTKTQARTNLRNDKPGIKYPLPTVSDSTR